MIHRVFIYSKGLLLATFFLLHFAFGGEAASPMKKGEGVPALQGRILNVGKDTLRMEKYYKDSMIFMDSIMTDEQGRFEYDRAVNALVPGMYRLTVKKGQYMDLLLGKEPVEVRSAYHFNAFANVVSDSVEVLKSKENKLFYDFIRTQKKVRIAERFLLRMMRIYPRTDPFHERIKKEYHQRHEAMGELVESMPEKTMAARIAKAYHIPVLPDWKRPDPERKKAFRAHFFDGFAMADTFYLHTPILKEKVKRWFSLFDQKNKSKSWHQKQYIKAVDTLFHHTMGEPSVYQYTRGKVLEMMRKKHFDRVLVHIYDNYSNPEACEKDEQLAKKVEQLRKLQPGKPAPEFSIPIAKEQKLSLSKIQTPYTLLVFWASWCPHCKRALPEVKQVISKWNKEHSNRLVTTVAVSLDTNRTAWKSYVQKGFKSWLHLYEGEGWDGEVPEMYNVNATPTFYLLDRQKKIVGKPENPAHLRRMIGG